MNLKLAALALSVLPVAAFAAEEQKSPLTASAELGMLYKTGNTKSADLKTGLDFKYEQDLWRSTLALDLLYKKTEKETDGVTEFETSDQKWTIESKTNYTLDTNTKNYVYGDVSYEDDRFGSFDNSTSVSAGWGRQWIKNEDHSLFADIGPGYKRDVTKATDEHDSETISSFIIQAQALYTTKINSHVEFEQKLSAKFAPESDDNSKYKAESSITTKLIETLQLKFSLVIDHNTKVDEGKKKTDTQTAITLVYSF